MMIERLLSYRDSFAYDYEDMYRWVDTYEEDGIIYPGYPEYDKTVFGFINDVYDSGLLIRDYSSVLDRKGVRDVDTLINDADMLTLRAVLSYYVRGEHKKVGLWGRGVRKMCFLRMLDRLEELVRDGAVAA
ncbi:MAG: hypothetical protein IKK58_05780 [Clostridia bacterium]|nr:hypothetical protein [Clostridia bacterium]